MNHIIGMKVIKPNQAVSHYPLDIFFLEELFILETSFKSAVVFIPRHNLSELGKVKNKNQFIVTVDDLMESDNAPVTVTHLRHNLDFFEGL